MDPSSSSTKLYSSIASARASVRALLEQQANTNNNNNGNNKKQFSPSLMIATTVNPPHHLEQQQPQEKEDQKHLNNNLKQQIQTLQQELSSTNTSLSQSASLIETLRNHINFANKERDEAIRNLDKISAERLSDRTQLHQIRERGARLEKEIEFWKRETSSWKSELEALYSETSQTKQVLKKVLAKIKQDENEENESASKMKILLQEKNQLLEQINILNKEHAELSAANSVLSQDKQESDRRHRLLAEQLEISSCAAITAQQQLADAEHLLQEALESRDQLLLQNQKLMMKKIDCFQEQEDISSSWNCSSNFLCSCVHQLSIKIRSSQNDNNNNTNKQQEGNSSSFSNFILSNENKKLETDLNAVSFSLKEKSQIAQELHDQLEKLRLDYSLLKSELYCSSNIILPSSGNNNNIVKKNYIQQLEHRCSSLETSYALKLLPQQQQNQNQNNNNTKSLINSVVANSLIGTSIARNNLTITTTTTKESGVRRGRGRILPFVADDNDDHEKQFDEDNNNSFIDDDQIMMTNNNNNNQYQQTRSSLLLTQNNQQQKGDNNINSRKKTNNNNNVAVSSSSSSRRVLTVSNLSHNNNNNNNNNLDSAHQDLFDEIDNI
jgi:hypothetical protein